MSDLFHLERFVEAQDPVVDRVYEELRQGRKASHWMWFVFPQIAGLGFSAMSQKYAITGVEEAQAYLAHPILGPRLRRCTQLVLDVDEKNAHGIFGSPDDMKFHSSMTLFARIDQEDGVFRQALDRYFDRQEDTRTLSRLVPR